MILIIALTLTLLGSSMSADDVEHRSAEFFKCVGCAEDKQDEYMKCYQVEPESWKNSYQYCQKALVSGPIDLNEVWRLLCYNVDGFRDNLYNCWMKNHTRINDLDQSQKTQAELYMQCVQTLDKQYCGQQ